MAFRFPRRTLLTGSAGVAALAATGCAPASERHTNDLWSLYSNTLARAKYVYLSHVLTPSTPIWYGFDATRTRFEPAVSGSASVKQPGEAFTYSADGFEATAYTLPTDQFGTQLDPPAHWNPIYPAIDELPASIAVRPLVVVSMVEQVKANPGYSLTVDDVKAWERAHGVIPQGSVVMVRSDWSTRWDEPNFATTTPFPGVSLAALQFLHLERHILFHGHEPLDTDDTPTLEGESWLMNHGYLQAEGVTNLHLVPPTGALITVGFPRFAGGTGGFASYVAICPPEWPHGVAPGDEPDAPFAPKTSPLQWDAVAGHRVRR